MVLKLGFQEVKLVLSENRQYQGLSAVLIIPMTLLQSDLYAHGKHSMLSVEKRCELLNQNNTYKVDFDFAKSRGCRRKVRSKKGMPAKEINIGYVQVEIFYTGTNAALFASHIRHVMLSIKRELKGIFGV